MKGCTELQPSTQSLVQLIPKLWGKLCSSIWYDGPRNSMQTYDPGHVYLGQLCTCIGGFTGIKWATLVKWSTTTQIESYPDLVLGNPVIKSMPSLSHFHSGIGIGCSNPAGFWCSAFTLSGIHHLRLHTAQCPSSYQSTRNVPSNPNTSWCFWGESSTANHGPLAELTSWSSGL